MFTRITFLLLFCTLCLFANSQNVGIGTTTPSNQLTVSGNADFTGNVGIGTASPAGKLHLKSGNLVLEDVSQRFFRGGYPKWEINGLTSGYEIARTGANTDFFIDGYTGNVGIGTNNPNNELTVIGSASFTGNMGIGITSPPARLSVGGTAFFSGNVGLGIINPADKFHLKAGNLLIDDGIQRFLSNGTPKWEINGSSASYIISRTGTPADFFINGTNGKIGIGNTNPLAPLHVSGSPYLTASLARSYFHANSGPDLISGTAASGDIKVIADGYFWANGGGFVATSDKRIKNIKGLSDTKSDLDLLNKIEVTDYTYIDKINNGATDQKKVIAQQLQSVYPQAVNTNKGVIPNVFEVAASTKVENGVTLITTNKPHSFVNGDQVKLILENTGEKMVAVIVLNPTTFSVNEKINDKVFVYGKLVNDLLNVDYDAVSMLNVSATKELYKKTLALETENGSLKESNKNLTERIAAIEEKMEQMVKSTPKPIAAAN